MAAGRFEFGSTVRTDEHPAYKSMGQRGYDHCTVNHSEGEYVYGGNNGYTLTIASAARA